MNIEVVEYSKVNVKLSDSQLNKLKSPVKNQTVAILTMNIKMFKGNNLPHELLLTTRQNVKLKTAFENNMSTDIKLCKNTNNLNDSIWRMFRFINK